MLTHFSSLRRAGWTFLALLFLIISWLWDQLNFLISWLVDRIPLARFKARVLDVMAQLPPYPTLFVFIIPFVVTEPLKIVSIWLLATGQIFLSVLIYIGAQIMQLGLVSFIFNHCKDKLLSIAWFAELYLYFQRLHHWADAQVAPLRERARFILGEARAFIAAQVAHSRSRFMRHVTLIWERIRKR
jgi:hypothetical protein